VARLFDISKRVCICFSCNVYHAAFKWQKKFLYPITLKNIFYKNDYTTMQSLGWFSFSISYFISLVFHLYQPARKYLSMKQKQHAIPCPQNKQTKIQVQLRYELQTKKVKINKRAGNHHLENKKIYTKWLLGFRA